jgi:hypothetical protein
MILATFAIENKIKATLKLKHFSLVQVFHWDIEHISLKQKKKRKKKEYDV